MAKPISIEINLNDVFVDEDGYPVDSVEESIRRQVINEVARVAKEKVGGEIHEAVSKAVNKIVDEAVADKVPGMIETLLDEEYTPQTEWGEKKEATSIRKELIKRFQEEFQYKKKDRYGNYQRTKFSEAVDKFVEEKLYEFKSEFNNTVATQFNAAAMRYVAEIVAKKFASI